MSLATIIPEISHGFERVNEFYFFYAQANFKSLVIRCGYG
jgi:hypothetical protein